MTSPIRPWNKIGRKMNEPLQDEDRGRPQLVDLVGPVLIRRHSVDDGGVGGQMEDEVGPHGKQAQQRVNATEDELMLAQWRCRAENIHDKTPSDIESRERNSQ